MQTFSCGVPQTVEIEGVSITFLCDPDDYAICQLEIGGQVASFNRNGMLIGVSEPPPKNGEKSEEPQSIGQEPEAGHANPPEGDAQP